MMKIRLIYSEGEKGASIGKWGTRQYSEIINCVRLIEVAVELPGEIFFLA